MRHRTDVISDLDGRTGLDLASEGARRVLEDHERMLLVAEDREAFLRAVAKPPRPSPRLVAAIRKHGR